MRPFFVAGRDSFLVEFAVKVTDLANNFRYKESFPSPSVVIVLRHSRQAPSFLCIALSWVVCSSVPLYHHEQKKQEEKAAVLLGQSHLLFLSDTWRRRPLEEEAGPKQQYFCNAT